MLDKNYFIIISGVEKVYLYHATSIMKAACSTPCDTQFTLLSLIFSALQKLRLLHLSTYRPTVRSKTVPMDCREFGVQNSQYFMVH